MRKSVRVVLDHDGDADQKMTIDLVLEADLSVRPGMPFVGWWGSLKSEDVALIAILSDGRVDYGSDEETDQKNRFGKINIHSKKIILGEYVTYFSRIDGEQTMFRVSRIVDLLD